MLLGGIRGLNKCGNGDDGMPFKADTRRLSLYHSHLDHTALYSLPQEAILAILANITQSFIGIEISRFQVYSCIHCRTKPSAEYEDIFLMVISFKKPNAEKRQAAQASGSPAVRARQRLGIETFIRDTITIAPNNIQNLSPIRNQFSRPPRVTLKHRLSDGQLREASDAPLSREIPKFVWSQNTEYGRIFLMVISLKIPFLYLLSGTTHTSNN